MRRNGSPSLHLNTSGPKPHRCSRAGLSPRARITSGQPQDSTTPTSKPLKAFPYIHADANKLDGAHKPLGLVAVSSFILASVVQVSGVAAASPLWLPVMAGGVLGATYAALNRAARKHAWRSPSAPLTVVITGATRGIGKSLAREFLRSGDRVIVTSRSQAEATAGAMRLAREAGVDPSAVVGIACDVGAASSVSQLTEEAAARFGSVDVWVNNAGFSGSFKPFIEQTEGTIEQVVRTNLIGSLLCTRAAMLQMVAQQEGGHIFNVEGAGSDGMASPQYAAYGATKAAIAQLCTTLQQEAATLPDARVGIHNISPGMVLTDLLLEGATLENKRAFDILCEHPETVAAFLVPRMRSTVAGGLSGQRIRYLTPLRALSKFATAPVRIGRYFDAEGNPVYPSEEERLNGQHAKRTQRLAERASRRSAGLGLAYSASIAAAYFILALDQVAKAHGG